MVVERTNKLYRGEGHMEHIVYVVHLAVILVVWQIWLQLPTFMSANTDYNQTIPSY